LKLWKKKIGESLSLVYGLYGRLRNHGTGRLVLMYHSVSLDLVDGYSDIYTINQSLFQEHMHALKELLEVSELNTETIFQDGASVTFDDGYADNLEIAAHILDDLNVPFTVFVTSDFVKSNNKKYLSATALRDLSTLSGVTIGAHGASHRRLTECDDLELYHELHDSKAFIEDILHIPVDSISYPHGAVDQRVINAVVSNGYKYAFGSRFGINRDNRESHNMSRTEIWGNDDLDTFLAKVRGDWDWMRWRN